MALTILKRPSGCRLSETANNTYSISSDGYGTAILSGGSGLTTGQTIFIYNSYSSYNGFWIITSYGPGAFRLQRYSGSSYLEYAQSIAVTIYPCVATVKYSAVHLPIVYTLGSTLWPINTTDSYRSVVGFHNDNGFIRLTLSGSIDAEALDWLRVSASSEDSLDGPFQILTKYSPTQFTISAPWSIAAASAYTFLTALVQKYYHNYTAHIRVYGGLPTTHLWYALKPYELIVEYKVNPDEAAIIKMNVADILKEKIEILLNRPNYDSMPYDLDRFAFFYIEYAESYDDSDGAAVETFTSSYQSDFDFFQGVAVDAKLEFKNRYSGLMSEYCFGGGNKNTLPLFLVPTCQRFNLPSAAEGDSCIQRATIFPGWYFDLSFINHSDTSFNVSIQGYDENDNNNSVTTIGYSPASFGVFRVPITIPTDAFYIIVEAVDTGVGNFPHTIRLDVWQKCYDQFIYLTWKNPQGGFCYWLFTANKDYNVNILETQEKDKNIYPQWDESYNEFSDTLKQEVSRRSRNEVTVRSQNLTRDQIDYIKGIKSSALVMQMTSKFDRRRVILDTSGFTVRGDEQRNAFEIQFTIIYTDEIPSQSL